MSVGVTEAMITEGRIEDNVWVVNGVEVKADDFVEEAGSGRSALKRITLISRDKRSSPALERLKSLCEEKGIELAIESPTSKAKGP